MTKLRFKILFHYNFYFSGGDCEGTCKYILFNNIFFEPTFCSDLPSSKLFWTSFMIYSETPGYNKQTCKEFMLICEVIFILSWEENVRKLYCSDVTKVWLIMNCFSVMAWWFTIIMFYCTRYMCTCSQSDSGEYMYIA